MELHCTREIYVYNIYMLIQSLEHYPLSYLDVICLSPPVLLLPLLATDPRKRRFHVTCLTYDDLTAQTWQQEIFLALLISALKQTGVISVRIRGICLLGAKINSPLKSFPFHFLPNNPQYISVNRAPYQARLLYIQFNDQHVHPFEAAQLFELIIIAPFPSHILRMRPR